jgi:aminotransferase MxcL
VPERAGTDQMRIVNLATTSVGRELVRKTYESFFRHVHFSGLFDVVVTIDPAYNVPGSEVAETRDFFERLPQTQPRVRKVIVEQWDSDIGLERSLRVLLAHCFHRFGVNLEDDWWFFGDVDLDALLHDLADLDATMIGFSSTHLVARGTFERSEELEPVPGTRVPLLRLRPPNWACDYVPLCPNVHDNHCWIPLFTKALAINHAPERCPDERVKEYVRMNGLRDQYKVLWTRDIVVKDTGREWCAERGVTKSLVPEERERTRYGSPSVHLEDGELRLVHSLRMYERALETVPGQTQTFTKRYTSFVPGHYPAYADHGDGAKVVDVDGNVYIDFIGGLGALLLGYNHPGIRRAITSNVRRGTYQSLPTWLEIEASEAVVDCVPSAEMVRFLKTGGEACSAAVSLARHITGRSCLASCGYHGWHDQFEPNQPGAHPLLKAGTACFEVLAEPGAPLSIETVVDRLGGQLACVILALPYGRCCEREHLVRVQCACRQSGALFVLDEVVTGFRLALGGAQQHFDVLPDLTVLSKALGAGMPVSAVCGPRRLMKHMADLYVSTTFGGEILSLACVVAALEDYRTQPVVEHVRSLGTQLQEGLNATARRSGLGIIARGYPSMPYLQFADLAELNARRESVFLAVMAKSGVLFRRGVNFVSFAHSQADVQWAVGKAAAAIEQVAQVDK